MGFFSAIGSALGGIGSFVSNVASSVGSAVFSAGKALYNGLKEGGRAIVETIASWINNVDDLNDAPEYDPKYASIEETQKINELLEDLIEKYKEEAKKYDSLAEVIITEQLENLKRTMYDINKKYDNELIDSYIFNSFDNNLRIIKQQLDKIYSKQINTAFSFNNNTLLDILKISSGETKKSRLRNLAVDTIVEANNKLMKSLKEFTNEQHKFIEERIYDYINLIKVNYQKIKNNTEEQLKALELDIEDKKKLEKKYQSILENVSILTKLNSNNDEEEYI